mgnify:CR=1 FL=1
MKSLAKWFAKQAQIKQIERELHSYSDRELEDMGIDRWKIRDIAKGKYTNESRNSHSI